jgi:hypothetical protein
MIKRSRVTVVDVRKQLEDKGVNKIPLKVVNVPSLAPNKILRTYSLVHCSSWLLNPPLVISSLSSFLVTLTNVIREHALEHEQIFHHFLPL